MKRISIETPRLLLRSFSEDDAKDLFEYLSDPQVYKFDQGEPVNFEQAQKFAKDLTNNPNFWAVKLRSEQKVIGQLYFHQLEPIHLLTWELGYMLSPKYQQQGYGSEAAKALVEYSFTELGAHRIQAHCSPDNTASWKLLEKIGFRREGLLRKNIYFRKDEAGNPLWWDSFAYAKLESKFEVIEGEEK